jgi:hypothetical protein
MVDTVSILCPEDLVRQLFEARATGDVRRVMALTDPVVRSALAPVEGVRVELEAHRIEAEDAEHVHVEGRVRIINGGSLSDSPATWRVTVRGGRVHAIEPVNPALPRAHHAA